MYRKYYNILIYMKKQTKQTLSTSPIMVSTVLKRLYCYCLFFSFSWLLGEIGYAFHSSTPARCTFHGTPSLPITPGDTYWIAPKGQVEKKKITIGDIIEKRETTIIVGIVNSSEVLVLPQKGHFHTYDQKRRNELKASAAFEQQQLLHGQPVEVELYIKDKDNKLSLFKIHEEGIYISSFYKGLSFCHYQTQGKHILYMKKNTPLFFHTDQIKMLLPEIDMTKIEAWKPVLKPLSKDVKTIFDHNLHQYIGDNLHLVLCKDNKNSKGYTIRFFGHNYADPNLHNAPVIPPQQLDQALFLKNLLAQVFWLQDYQDTTKAGQKALSTVPQSGTYYAHSRHQAFIDTLINTGSLVGGGALAASATTGKIGKDTIFKKLGSSLFSSPGKPKPKLPSPKMWWKKTYLKRGGLPALALFLGYQIYQTYTQKNKKSTTPVLSSADTSQKMSITGLLLCLLLLLGFIWQSKTKKK